MSSPCPPPPPPLPGTPGATKLPSYKDQQDQLRQLSSSHQSDSIQEQQYANLPAKLMTAMNKDKKPFTYTLGGIGEGGILDLSEIKSPKMKKRIQANLRGVEEPGNEIKAPTPDLLSNLDESSAPSHKSPGLTFKLPPPPPKTIQALENSAFASPPPPPPLSHRITSPLDTRPSSALSNTYDSNFDEQLSNLCSGLNLKTDCNNNNLGKLYSFNNYNSSPKPFTPSSAPFSSSPFESTNNKPSAKLAKMQPQSSIDEAIDTGCFPRPPPPQIPLAPGAISPSVLTPEAGCFERSPSPLVANPPSAYAPNLQEQWLARKQQQLHDQFNPQADSSGSKMVLQRELMTGKPLISSSDYDEKMRKIRDAHSEYLPPNPITAYMPTLQEKWLQRKQQQQQQPIHQVTGPSDLRKIQGDFDWKSNTSKVEAEPERCEPIQSRSFKVLKKLTEGMEDELEAFKREQERNEQRQQQRQQQQHQQQQQQLYQQQPQLSSLWTREPSPPRSKSPIVPNPPLAYAPTLQEQWLMRKQQQQQQQQWQQPQSTVTRPVPFSPNVSSSGSQFTQLQSCPSQAQPRQQQQQQPQSTKGTEIIIPVRIEGRDESRTRSLNDQPPSPRYTGASFPSRSFQALRMMTGEDPFATFPSPSTFFTPLESQFISPTGFVGGATGMQGTDF